MWIVICAFFMLPVSLTSDCKLKVLSETISLEAARKYDPPGFSGAANLRVVVYFAFTRYLQWAQNTPFRLTEKGRVVADTLELYGRWGVFFKFWA